MSEENKPFGVDYVPAKKRAQIVNGRVAGGKVQDLPPGKAKAIHLERFSIALFNVDGKFYAVKDACPHAGYPLSKGVVEEGVVTCASHSWKFDLKTGACIKAEGKEKPSIRTFPVVIEGDDVYIVVQ